jgi:uncharacterized protein YqfA (UPF0365 family)
MNSDRGWYLVAIGVLALGISNSSISNSGIGNSSISDSARGFLDRAVAAADYLSAEARRALAVAQLTSDRGEIGWAHAQATIARAETRLALVQAKIDAKRAVSTRVHSWCAMSTRRQVAAVLSPGEDGDLDVDDLQ